MTDKLSPTRLLFVPVIAMLTLGACAAPPADIKVSAVKPIETHAPSATSVPRAEKIAFYLETVESQDEWDMRRFLSTDQTFDEIMPATAEGIEAKRLAKNLNFVGPGWAQKEKDRTSLYAYYAFLAQRKEGIDWDIIYDEAKVKIMRLAEDDPLHTNPEIEAVGLAGVGQIELSLGYEDFSGHELTHEGLMLKTKIREGVAVRIRRLSLHMDKPELGTTANSTLNYENKADRDLDELLKKLSDMGKKDAFAKMFKTYKNWRENTNSPIGTMMPTTLFQDAWAKSLGIPKPQFKELISQWPELWK